MTVTTFSDQHSSPVSSLRLFKALILDSHILIPKLIPQAVTSIEILGNGGVGSIKVINFAEGSQLKYVKYRIDELNPETVTYNYTLIEGDALSDKHYSVVYKFQFETSSEGETISKMTSMCTTVEDYTLDEEQLRSVRRKHLECTRLLKHISSETPTTMIKSPSLYPDLHHLGLVFSRHVSMSLLESIT